MITLTGNPLSTQNCYRATGAGTYTRVYMKAVCTDRKHEYIIEGKRQWKKKPSNKRFSISIDLFFGDKRKHDWDNFHKLSMDALSGIVWVDDEQIDECLVNKYYDKEDPRIEIEIHEL